MRTNRLFLTSAIAVCIGGVNLGNLRAQPRRPVFLPYLTRWGQEALAGNIHWEYPRPQMVRPDWLDLNGLWDLHITRLDHTNLDVFAGKIRVPFPVESVLSGVKQVFTPQERIEYRREFKVPAAWRGHRILLHFEAVDWKTTVRVNGHEVGTHRGGYDRFTSDITADLKPKGEQTLTVMVTDPTDTGFQPRGKQMLRPRPPFFEATSGIWQTVWLEPVPTTYIQSLKLTPDIDKGVLQLTAFVAGSDTNGCMVAAEALDGQTEAGRATGHENEPFDVPVPRAELCNQCPRSPMKPCKP